MTKIKQFLRFRRQWKGRIRYSWLARRGDCLKFTDFQRNAFPPLSGQYAVADFLPKCGEFYSKTGVVIFRKTVALKFRNFTKSICIPQ
jgi:hypothetical protein